MRPFGCRRPDIPGEVPDRNVPPGTPLRLAVGSVFFYLCLDFVIRLKHGGGRGWLNTVIAPSLAAHGGPTQGASIGRSAFFSFFNILFLFKVPTREMSDIPEGNNASANPMCVCHPSSVKDRTVCADPVSPRTSPRCLGAGCGVGWYL